MREKKKTTTHTLAHIKEPRTYNNYNNLRPTGQGETALLDSSSSGDNKDDRHFFASGCRRAIWCTLPCKCEGWVVVVVVVVVYVYLLGTLSVRPLGAQWTRTRACVKCMYLCVFCHNNRYITRLGAHSTQLYQQENPKRQHDTHTHTIATTTTTMMAKATHSGQPSFDNCELSAT